MVVGTVFSRTQTKGELDGVSETNANIGSLKGTTVSQLLYAGQRSTVQFVDRK